jgi:hypothetical protein
LSSFSVLGSPFFGTRLFPTSFPPPLHPFRYSSPLPSSHFISPSSIPTCPPPIFPSHAFHIPLYSLVLIRSLFVPPFVVRRSSFVLHFSPPPLVLVWSGRSLVLFSAFCVLAFCVQPAGSFCLTTPNIALLSSPRLFYFILPPVRPCCLPSRRFITISTFHHPKFPLLLPLLRPFPPVPVIFPTPRTQARLVVKDFAEIIAGRSPQAAALGGREDAHHQASAKDDFVRPLPRLFASIVPLPSPSPRLTSAKRIGGVVVVVFGILARRDQGPGGRGSQAGPPVRVGRDDTVHRDERRYHLFG